MYIESLDLILLKHATAFVKSAIVTRLAYESGVLPNQFIEAMNSTSLGIDYSILYLKNMYYSHNK